MNNKTIVIFDVGRTLINATHKNIIYYLVKKGKARIWFAITISFLFFLHKLIGTNEKIICTITKKAYSIFKGWSLIETDNLLKEFFEEDLKYKIYPEAIKKIKEHIDKNHEVVLVSALAPPVINIIKDFLGLRLMIVPQLETKDGKYTGVVADLIPYGINKRKLVEDLVKEEHLSLKESYVYTDRFSDLALLELADNPIVVNPELKLEKAAKDRGWEVYKFE